MSEALSILAMLLGMIIAAVYVYGRWVQYRSPVPSSTRRPPTVGPVGRAGNSGAAPARAPLPPALRAELDQTPRWWEDAFHQLLEISDAPVVLGERIDMHSYDGSVTVAYQARGYPECGCARCRRICQ